MMYLNFVNKPLFWGVPTDQLTCSCCLSFLSLRAISRNLRCMAAICRMISNIPSCRIPCGPAASSSSDDITSPSCSNLVPCCEEPRSDSPLVPESFSMSTRRRRRRNKSTNISPRKYNCLFPNSTNHRVSR